MFSSLRANRITDFRSGMCYLGDDDTVLNGESTFSSIPNSNNIQEQTEPAQRKQQWFHNNANA